jgi:hypothetical protein
MYVLRNIPSLLLLLQVPNWAERQAIGRRQQRWMEKFALVPDDGWFGMRAVDHRVYEVCLACGFSCLDWNVGGGV